MLASAVGTLLLSQSARDGVITQPALVETLELMRPPSVQPLAAFALWLVARYAADVAPETAGRWLAHSDRIVAAIDSQLWPERVLRDEALAVLGVTDLGPLLESTPPLDHVTAHAEAIAWVAGRSAAESATRTPRAASLSHPLTRVAGNDRLDEPGEHVIDVAGDGDPRRNLRRCQQALNVAGHGGRRVQHGVLAQGLLVGADALGVAPAEVIVGEGARPALGVVDDGDLEQRPVGQHVLGDLADERDVVDHLRGDPPTDVAHDDGVAQSEAEDVRRVDARVQARDHEQAQSGEDDRALMAAGGGEGAVALERRIDGGDRCRVGGVGGVGG